MTFGGGEVAGAGIKLHLNPPCFTANSGCSNPFNFITSQHRGMFPFILIIILEYMSDEETSKTRRCQRLPAQSDMERACTDRSQTMELIVPGIYG